MFPQRAHPIEQELVNTADSCFSPSLLWTTLRSSIPRRTVRRALKQIHNLEARMKAESLQDLYLEQLKDLYDAENQLIKALPKMAKAASSEELRNAFEEHLEQTKEQAQRLETIFEGMGEKAKGQKCKAMEGLIKEGSEVSEEDMAEGVKDAALIAAAQRVEHYEIAGYGCVRTYANLLGESEAANLLEKTLEEEKEADGLLGGIAEQINVSIPQERNESAKRNANTSGRKSRAA
jgi:ferritin-like metal-binding protein YciE